MFLFDIVMVEKKIKVRHSIKDIKEDRLLIKLL